MSTEALELGPDPEDMTVTLIRGGSWWAELQSVVSETDDTPVSYEAGDGVELHLGEQVWAATITTYRAVWDVDAVDVAAVVAALENVRNPEAVLWYVSNGRRIPWALGLVRVRG